jgi:hypothetical protein
MKGICVPLAVATLLALGSVSTPAAKAQDRSEHAIPAGTRFLVALNVPIGTKESKKGDQIELRTLEAVEAPDGKTLREGAAIHAHVDKVEQAHQTGRARMWITFDEIETERGWVPFVADVSAIPGVHSVKVDSKREGEITTRSNQTQDEAMATAAGALVGGAPGVAAKNTKDAAFGAATGAATAFMASSGLGQDFVLDKDTKMELTLDWPLALGRK